MNKHKDISEKVIDLKSELQISTNKLTIEENKEKELTIILQKLQEKLNSTKREFGKEQYKKRKAKDNYEKLLRSTSWKLSSPIRNILDMAKGKKKNKMSSKDVITSVNKNNPKMLETRIKDIENKLWSGFSKYAYEELEHIKSSEEYPLNDRIKASRVLARWFYDNQQYQQALETLDFSTDLKKSKKPHIDTVIRRIKVLKRLERYKEAEKMIWDAISIHGLQSDLCLSMAHLKSDPMERLSWINLIYGQYGYAEVKVKDKNQPLSLENIYSPIDMEEDGGVISSDMLERYKISIIIPAYNAGDSIHIALDGLLEQTHKNFEIIIVDDCSPDNTIEVIEKYQELDKRIKVIKKEKNEGAYAARNTALEYVTGDFITIHDSDDWSHSQKLEVQLRELINNPLAVGTISYLFRSFFDISPVNAGSLLSTKFLLFNSSSLLVHKKVFSELGGWDNVRVGGDSEFIKRIEKVYGNNSIIRVKPEVPFSFSLSNENSLTGTGTTHIKTIRYGLRRTYKESYQWWHENVSSTEDLYIKPGNVIRKFPCPVPNLVNKPKTRSYDVVFVSDFTVPLSEQNISTIINDYVLKGKKIAIFHWPYYQNDVYQLLSEDVYSLANKHSIDFLVVNEEVDTDITIYGESYVLDYALDSAPIINSKKSYVIETEQIDDSILKRRSDTIKKVFGQLSEWTSVNNLSKKIK